MPPELQRLLDVVLRSEPRARPRSTLRAALGTVVAIGVALPVAVWLDGLGLLTGPPWLVAVLLVLPGLVSGDAVQRAIGGGRLDTRPGLRMALATTAFGVLLGVAGWPALLPVSAAIPAVFHIQRSGSRTWPVAALVVVAGTAVLEVAALLGGLPTVLEPAESATAAVWSAATAALVIGNVGIAVRRREESERRLEAAVARLNALMDSSPDVVLVVDGEGLITYANPVAHELGHAPEALVGRRLVDLADPEHRSVVAAQLARIVSEGRDARAKLDVLVALATHEGRWYEWSVHNLLDDPLVAGLVVDLRDITERRQHSAELEHAARHDPLTGLPNRAELMWRLARTVPECGPGAAVALLFIDLDGFKAVNDSLGHAAGDDVLTVVARRLQAGTRRHDHLARLGGDEFCAILTEVRDAEEVRAVVDRMETELAEPITVRGRLIRISASIGVAMTAEPTTDPERLLAEADGHMYAAKRRT